MNKQVLKIETIINDIKGLLSVLKVAASVGKGATYGAAVADDIEQAARDLKAILRGEK